MWPTSWLKGLDAGVRFDEPLSRHTTLQIGGPADVWLKPRHQQSLCAVISHCRQKKIPYLVIGRGSNILFSDEGFRGAVIALGQGPFSRIAVDGTRVTCGAGAAVNSLLRETWANGLSGLEFLAGIPASIGGAVVMNAGNRQESVGCLVKGAAVIDHEAGVRQLGARDLYFSYRSSNLAGYVVAEVCLELTGSAPEKIRERITGYLRRKRETQDLPAKSAGCVFKNPAQGLSAGAMIDACGLKGRRCGGAEISAKHANFIINRDNARASDVLRLIELIQREVEQRFNVRLETEIKVI